MKRLLLLACFIFVSAAPAASFLYEIKMSSTEEIKAMNDKALTDAYIEAKIEEKASREFVEAAGFNSAKDYGNRKKLLRYIFDLRREIGTRASINIDDIDKYLE